VSVSVLAVAVVPCSRVFWFSRSSFGVSSIFSSGAKVLLTPVKAW